MNKIGFYKLNQYACYPNLKNKNSRLATFLFLGLLLYEAAYRKLTQPSSPVNKSPK